jgi:hypothetical protein
MADEKKDTTTAAVTGNFTDVEGSMENLDDESLALVKKFNDEAVPLIKEYTDKMRALGFPTMSTAIIPAKYKDNGEVGTHLSVNYTPEFVSNPHNRKPAIVLAMLTGALPLPPDVEDAMYVASMATLIRKSKGMPPLPMGKRSTNSSCSGGCTREQELECAKIVQDVTRRVLANEPGILTSQEPFHSPCGGNATLGDAAMIVKRTIDSSPGMRRAAEDMVGMPLSEEAVLGAPTAPRTQAQEDADDEEIRRTFEALGPKHEEKPN